MNILSLYDLNKNISDNSAEFIDGAEIQYHDRIRVVAEHLSENSEEMPIILISGPSGSGKTTTALRLGTMLEEAGKTVHTVSMDNYFIPIDDPRNEVDEDGRIDLESPKRLDMDLLNEHLRKLWRCEEIEIPTFDFSTQQRLPGRTMKRNNGEFVVIEGIHALNPQITGNIGKHATTVYVSVRTRLKNQDGELLHPSKIRLMRRLVRDKLFRGRNAVGTLDFFKWVERGEQRFILPYKGNAMYDIDTFISYEPAVYKPFVLPDLLAVKDTYPDYNYYSDLEEFLLDIDDMEREIVPLNSLVREFVGGSNYTY